MAPLLAALKARQLRRQELTMALAATEQQPASRLDRRRIERDVRQKLHDCRGAAHEARRGRPRVAPSGTVRTGAIVAR
jgi:hypothetical protein